MVIQQGWWGDAKMHSGSLSAPLGHNPESALGPTRAACISLVYGCWVGCLHQHCTRRADTGSSVGFVAPEETGAASPLCQPSLVGARAVLDRR